jgi:parallel beta-helix repeat protein
MSSVNRRIGTGVILSVLAALLLEPLVIAFPLPASAEPFAQQGENMEPVGQVGGDTYVTSTVIYVPDDYPTIQAAVDAASPGDTIIVRDGTYIENVDVNKSLTIRSENGAEVTIVQAANPNDPVFEVRVNYVSISGFTVKGATGTSGIYLNSANYSEISNNKLSDNNWGIHLLAANNNKINNCTVYGSERGIYLEHSSHNVVENCTLQGPGGEEGQSFGIWIEYEESTDNLIKNCTISGYTFGIHIKNAHENTIESCTLYDNYWAGILVKFNSHNNTIRDCLVYGDTDTGIDISSSSNGNRVENCTIYGVRSDGIYIFASEDNVITNCIIHDTPLNGILVGELEDPAGTYNNTIANCEIYNCFRGINLWYDSSRNTIENCTIYNCAQGINVEISSNTNEIRNCRIYSNSKSGMRFNASEDNKVVDSNIYDNAEAIPIEASASVWFVNTSIDDIYVDSGMAYIEWYLTVVVTSRGQPVEDAEVDVYYAHDQSLAASGATDSEGKVRFTLPEKILRSGMEEYIGVYRIRATRPGMEGEESCILSESKEVTISLRIYDLDGDGDVDVDDIMEIASRWRTREGEEGYDPKYDFDGDGDIDIIDIMKVAAHWGESYE